MQEDVTGQDATLKFGSEKTEIPVSNVSWNREVNTDDVQHNDGLGPTKVVTGLRYNGSFEYEGRNYDVQNLLLRAKEDSSGATRGQKNSPIKGTLSVSEKDIVETGQGEATTEFLYTFKGVIITSQNRDIPSDGVASTSWDWEAEDVTVKKE
jgi:hypothetical protein